MRQIKLTQTVQKGGCAAKVAGLELRKILSAVKFPTPHSELLVDGSDFDDAAVYKVTEDLALVQTLDFFTPIVDTPRIFGAVAAANALSDVYAMGGKPKTAMAILAFPLATMPYEIAVEVLQGASDKIAEAGANFVGGHSIDDDTLKFGLSVTGYVHPRSVWSNRKARAGDRLILTKPLGTGTLTAALKRQEVAEQDIAEGIESMARLNNVVDYLGGELLSAIQAATDVTGFGFAGHASHLMKASGLGLDVNAEAIPRFSQTMEFLERGYLTKAHRTNAEYTNGLWYSEVSPLMRLLLHDPQTSGGLLLAVDPTCSESIVQALSQSFPGAAMVGVFTDEHNKLRIVE